MPVLKRPSSQGVESSRKRPASTIASVVAELKDKTKEDATEDTEGDVRHKGKVKNSTSYFVLGSCPHK